MIEYRLIPSAPNPGGDTQYFRLERKRTRPGLWPFAKEVYWDYETIVRPEHVAECVKHLGQGAIYVNCPE